MRNTSPVEADVASVASGLVSAALSWLLLQPAMVKAVANASNDIDRRLTTLMLDLPVVAQIGAQWLLMIILGFFLSKQHVFKQQQSNC